MATTFYDTGNMQPGEIRTSSYTASGGGGTVPQAPSIPRIGAPSSVISGGYNRAGQPYDPSIINYKSNGQWKPIGANYWNYGPGGAAAGAPGTDGKTAPMGLVTNPFQPSAIQSAQAAGSASAGQGTSNLSQADIIRNMGAQGVAPAGQMLNTAFDPQNALYSRTSQQLQDQVRAGEAARGIAMSPYGAGVENKAMSDFNIDWQNNQLGRQTQGLGAFGSYLGSLGSGSTAGANVGQVGVGQINAQGQLPYQQFQNNQANDINNWLSIVQAQQQNYPLTMQQTSFQNAGGVPYIPQNGNTFNF